MNNRDIIRKKLNVAARLREYLIYSHGVAVHRNVIGRSGDTLTLEEGDILAAFRMRFAEYQEQLGKLISAIAREEDIELKGASSLAAFAEKFEFVDSEEDWKRIRDIRNNINHDYEEDEVSELSWNMNEEIPIMIDMLNPIRTFCLETYGIELELSGGNVQRHMMVG